MLPPDGTEKRRGISAPPFIVVSVALQKSHGVGRHSLARTRKAKPLLSGGFHIHLVLRNAQMLGQILAHLWDKGGQFGLLGHQSSIHVSHTVSGLSKPLNDPVQQQQTGDPRIGGICLLYTSDAADEL